MALFVNEIFSSIQGESLWTGLPCTFIRLSGCNLHCHYCDTQYAYNQGEPWESKAILAQVEQRGFRRVTITGGEPLMQPETHQLVALLLSNGYDVSMETNGSIDVSGVDQRVMKVIDIKCPSSGMHHKNRMDNVHALGVKDQIKFVISDHKDYRFALRRIREPEFMLSMARVLFSPVHGVLAPQQLAAWILEDQLEVRLHIQLHRYVWPSKTRGV